MRIAVEIYEDAGSSFSKFQLWRHILYGLIGVKEIQVFLCRTWYWDGSPATFRCTRPIAGDLDQILEDYLSFHFRMGPFAKRRRIDKTDPIDCFLTLGFVDPIPHLAPLVYTIVDLAHWTGVRAMSEPERLRHQSSILSAMKAAQAFVFLNESLRVEFESLFPGWLESSRKPFRILSFPTSGVSSLDQSGNEQSYLRSCGRENLVGLMLEIHKHFD
jgi:hypothetical protein